MKTVFALIAMVLSFSAQAQADIKSQQVRVAANRIIAQGYGRYVEGCSNAANLKACVQANAQVSESFGYDIVIFTSANSAIFIYFAPGTLQVDESVSGNGFDPGMGGS